MKAAQVINFNLLSKTKYRLALFVVWAALMLSNCCIKKPKVYVDGEDCKDTRCIKCINAKEIK